VLERLEEGYGRRAHRGLEDSATKFLAFTVRRMRPELRGAATDPEALATTNSVWLSNLEQLDRFEWMRIFVEFYRLSKQRQAPMEHPRP